MTRIIYWVPDSSAPSWGVGLLCEHVRLLRTESIDAWCIGPGCARAWRDGEATDLELDSGLDELTADDVLVVPEVSLVEIAEARCRARIVLFVQGSAPLFSAISGPDDLIAIRERVELVGTITILPHLEELLRSLYGIEAAIVPPFVRGLFFEADRQPERERRVLVHAKGEVEATGVPGSAVLENFWLHKAPRDWSLTRLAGFRQAEVAELFARSSLFINLNLVEAFNTTVPEAMAAGCPVLCYPAVGGADFLEGEGEGANAFVAGTADIGALAGRLFSMLHSWDTESTQSAVEIRRANGLETASRFTEERTLRHLIRFLRSAGLVE